MLPLNFKAVVFLNNAYQVMGILNNAYQIVATLNNAHRAVTTLAISFKLLLTLAVNTYWSDLSAASLPTGSQNPSTCKHS